MLPLPGWTQACKSWRRHPSQSQGSAWSWRSRRRSCRSPTTRPTWCVSVCVCVCACECLCLYLQATAVFNHKVSTCVRLYHCCLHTQCQALSNDSPFNDRASNSPSLNALSWQHETWMSSRSGSGQSWASVLFRTHTQGCSITCSTFRRLDMCHARTTYCRWLQLICACSLSNEPLALRQKHSTYLSSLYFFTESLHGDLGSYGAPCTDNL